MQVGIELLLPVTTFFVPSLTPIMVVTFSFMILVMLLITMVVKTSLLLTSLLLPDPNPTPDVADLLDEIFPARWIIP